MAKVCNIFAVALFLGSTTGRPQERSSARAMPRETGCEVVSTQGETAELPFPIQHDALTHEDFFAHLRKSDGTDIVICDRNSPVKCNPLDPRYQANDIVNDSLTIQIPHVIREFEDTYVFQTYAAGKPLPPSVCRLTVTAIPKRNVRQVIGFEGREANLTFFIGHDALALPDFFAHLRRSDDTDIAICDRNSFVSCKTLDPRYYVQGIKNGSLTILIPVVTHSFEDTYVFQAYAGGKPLARSDCRLTVKDATLAERCSASMPAKGETAEVKFFIAEGLLVRKESKIRLRRADNPGADIMVCDQRLSASAKCKVLNALYKSEGIVNNNTLSLRIPNMSSDFEDIYILQVFQSGSPKVTNICYLKLQRHVTDENNGNLSLTAAPVFLVFVIVIVIAIAILFLFRKRIRDFLQNVRRNYDTESRSSDEQSVTQTEDQPETEGGQMRENDPSQSSPEEAPLLQQEDTRSSGAQRHKDSHEQKRWFAGKISDEEVDKMFQYEKNGAGSFVITQSKTDTKSFTLAVRFKDGTQAPERFTITQTESRAFTFQEKEEAFETLCAFVGAYKMRPITIDGHLMGKLKKPCVEKPTEMWYFGALGSEEIKTLLLSEEAKPGCFLVTDSIAERQNYTLSVKFNDRVEKFSITYDDDGFTITRQKSRMRFRMLGQLVEHYKANNIEDNTVWGKLGIPCVRK